MQSMRIIDSLEGIRDRGISSCVLLYSGGVDGSYFLDWAQQQHIEVVALCIGLEGAERHKKAMTIAQELGAHYVFRDLTAEFLADYVAPAIKANAYYQMRYPVCSSLSRPLLTKAAVELAHQLGMENIAHTSTYMQNSAARFTLSLMALDPQIVTLAPFLRSQDTRESKIARLRQRGILLETSAYSVDTNIWGRVIESGLVENPEQDLPLTALFSWTKDIEQTPDVAETLEIEFQEGLPVALNGRACSLLEIVQELNVRGGLHGIGRFSGLEDITFGAKNHEVREAPAAHILLSAHRELEAAILSQAELSLKQYLDMYWTNMVVSGSWYTHLARAVYAFIERMNILVNGRVRLKLHRGNLMVVSRQSDHGLYYTKFKEDFAKIMQNYSFPSTYTIMGLPLLQRENHCESFCQEMTSHHR
jgi:argininosuccinate synthase